MNTFEKRRKRTDRKRKKKKKLKAKLTPTFCQTEQQVQVLLEEVQQSLNVSSCSNEVESDTQSAEFFCKVRARSVLQLNEETLNAEQDAAAHLKTPSDETSLQSENRSTYIQIDALEEPVTLPIVKRQYLCNTDSWLYKPAAQLHACILLPADMDKLTANMVRMLNRYYVEQQQVTTQLVACLMSEQLCKRDKNLYRTYCAKQFTPIFCNANAQLVQIPTSRLLKLHIKQLRFTEHPELLQEHRLANACAAAYAEYMQNKQQRKHENLQQKLHEERAVMQEMLQQARYEHALQPHEQEQTAQQMLLLQSLRENLYAADLHEKQLLQTVLDRWLQLKQLRKSQSQQYTSFKLRINVKPKHDNNWQLRYESDLQEIYGEQLQLYFRQHRAWKQTANEKLQIKPQKPIFKKIAKQLYKKYKTIYAEPLIELQRCDEQVQQLTVATTKMHTFFMRIYLDQQLVGSTLNYRLETDFSCYINETFGVLLQRSLPKEVCITLYEKCKLPAQAKKLMKLVIALPAAQQQNNLEICNKSKNYYFNAKQQPISGYVSLSISYEQEPKSLNNMSLEQPLIYEKTKEQLMLNNEAEAEELELEVDNLATANTCSFEEERLLFCNMNELKLNRRFRLLRSRYLQNDARTKDLRFIPTLEHEIVHEWFDDAQNAEHVLEMGNWMQAIDLQHHQGKKYLKSLYEAISDQCARLSKGLKSGDSLLVGDEPDNWSALFQAIVNIFRPVRLFAAAATERESATQSLRWQPNQKFKLVFTAVRATGIPVRDADIACTDARSSQESPNSFLTQKLKYANVSPFIALIYKDQMCRTLTAEGSSPTWNEQLVLQFSLDSNELREELKIALFDEVIESQVTDDANVRNVDIYQRIQTNWLAEYRLPLSTLFQQQKLEGVLELNTPHILCGYKRASFGADIVDSALLENEFPKFKESVYLWYYLSIEPLVQLPIVQTYCLECAELSEVRQQLNYWTQQVRELQPQRYIEPLICTAEGKRVCITRLLQSVPLPFDSNDEHLLEKIIRFVSQINVFKTYAACLRFQGMWLNNKLLLDTTWGSAKDLGVLLCNFLLAAGKKAYLVLGLAIAHIDVAFVLYSRSSTTQDYELCDPCSGKCYSVRDVFCPLVKIYCVVSQDNIFCNMQTENRVFMTNFNFNDISCWLPAFGKRNPAPIGGAQCLNYVYRDTIDTNEIRQNIERKIMKKLSSWRKMRKTLWNRALQTRLYGILQQLERNSLIANGSNNIDHKYSQQLAAEFPAYKLFGFTLNFPYINLTAISDHVKSTALHLNSDKTVEFSVAVHLEVYPNNIISVWIFLLAITQHIL